MKNILLTCSLCLCVWLGYSQTKIKNSDVFTPAILLNLLASDYNSNEEMLKFYGFIKKSSKYSNTMNSFYDEYLLLDNGYFSSIYIVISYRDSDYVGLIATIGSKDNFSDKFTTAMSKLFQYSLDGRYSDKEDKAFYRYTSWLEGYSIDVNSEYNYKNQQYTTTIISDNRKISSEQMIKKFKLYESEKIKQ